MKTKALHIMLRLPINAPCGVTYGKRDAMRWDQQFDETSVRDYLHSLGELK